MNKRVMVIDDEESIRFSLEEGLSDYGYQVRTSESLIKSKPLGFVKLKNCILILKTLVMKPQRM